MSKDKASKNTNCGFLLNNTFWSISQGKKKIRKVLAYLFVRRDRKNENKRL
jgi:hypothetical protein